MAAMCMLVTPRLTTTIKSFYQEVFGWTWSASGTSWVSFDEGPGKGGLISAPIDEGKLVGWYPCIEVS